MPLQRSPMKLHGKENSLKSFNSDPLLNQSTSNNENNDNSLSGRRNTKRKIENSPEKSYPILSELQHMFDKFEGRQNAKIEQMITNINHVKTQNEELQQSIEFISKKYDEFVTQIDDLRQENLSYKKRITDLESKMEGMERNQRACTMEVKNIPPQPSENPEMLCTIVKSIGDTIGYSINDSEISEVYRQRTKQGSNGHLIVHLKSIILKDQFIIKCRQFNRESGMNKRPKLNTSHINLPMIPNPHLPIYIDESLTGKTRRLRFLAKEFAIRNGYYGAWTAYGKVYLRKTEKSPTIRIDDEEDLQKLCRI